jgi:hypothetical protein
MSTKSRGRLRNRSPDPPAETPSVPKSGELSHDQVTLRSAGDDDDK